MAPMEAIRIRLPAEDVDELWKMVEAGRYFSISDAVRAMVARGLASVGASQ